MKIRYDDLYISWIDKTKAIYSLNIFSNIDNNPEISVFVENFIKKTNDSSLFPECPSFVKCEEMLLKALIAAICYEFPDDEKNLLSLVQLIGMMVDNGEDEDYKNPVDYWFDELIEKRDSLIVNLIASKKTKIKRLVFAIDNYIMYKKDVKNSNLTARSCTLRLSPIFFNNENLFGNVKSVDDMYNLAHILTYNLPPYIMGGSEHLETRLFATVLLLIREVNPIDKTVSVTSLINIFDILKNDSQSLERIFNKCQLSPENYVDSLKCYEDFLSGAKEPIQIDKDDYHTFSVKEIIDRCVRKLNFITSSKDKLSAGDKECIERVKELSK